MFNIYLPFTRLFSKHLITSLFLLTTSVVGLNGCTGVLFGLGTAAAVGGATEKGLTTSTSDATIKLKITDKFIQTDVDLAEAVTISVNAGSVLLTGNIETFEKKLLATKLSWEVKNVTEVINEVIIAEEMSFKDHAKDIAAAAELRAKIIADGDISSLNYSIDVVNGVVYLSGIASSDEERAKVVTHARGLRYAKKVVDYTALNPDDRD